MLNKTKYLLIYLFIFFIIFEIFSLTYLYFTSNFKKFEEIYFNLENDLDLKSLSSARGQFHYTNSLYPHPYLSYSTNPNHPLFKDGSNILNNLYYKSLNDAEFTKDKNYFYLGIFGGSVATKFANSKYVNQKIDQCYRYNDKKIKILNFSDGGYKQPQQIIALVLNK